MDKPPFLYKILSLENWTSSQKKETLQLSDMDDRFIHLATEEQLERILEKFWSHTSDYVVLKLDTDRLIGNLVLGSNPGGVNKYYHLYNGSIPCSAVIKFTAD